MQPALSSHQRVVLIVVNLQHTKHGIRTGRADLNTFVNTELKIIAIGTGLWFVVNALNKM